VAERLRVFGAGGGGVGGVGSGGSLLVAGLEAGASPAAGPRCKQGSRLIVVVVVVVVAARREELGAVGRAAVSQRDASSELDHRPSCCPEARWPARCSILCAWLYVGIVLRVDVVGSYKNVIRRR